MDKILLGNRIKEARTDRDFTLDELAEAVNMNKSTLSRYERGEIDKPKTIVVTAVANALHVNPAWLIGISEQKSYSPANSNIYTLEWFNLFRPIKTLREANGLTSEDAAYQVGVSKEQYEAIEQGCNTDCITLARIAALYCCSADYALSVDGITGEESQIAFTKGPLYRLHRAFYKLSAEEQQDVISYAEALQEKNKTVLRIAGRNGSFEEWLLTDQQMEELKAKLDQMPDASGDL